MKQGTFRVIEDNEPDEGLVLEFSLRDCGEDALRRLQDDCQRLSGVLDAQADFEEQILTVTVDEDYAGAITRRLPTMAQELSPEITVLPANEEAGKRMQTRKKRLPARKEPKEEADAESAPRAARQRIDAADPFCGQGNLSFASLLAVFGALIALAIHFLVKEGGIADIIFCILAVLLAGYPTALEAWGAVSRKEWTAPALWTAGAALLSCLTGGFFAAAAVLFLYQMYGLVLNWIKNQFAARSRRFSKLIPREASIIDAESGQMTTVEISRVKVGDTLVVMPNERVPVDGTVIHGSSTVSKFDLSGSKNPVSVAPGTEVYGGMLNGSATFKIRAATTAQNSLPARLEKMLEDAASHPAGREGRIRTVCRWLPIGMAGLSVIVFILSLILGSKFAAALGNALVLLVAASPVSLLLSASLGFTGAVQACAASGMMLRGGESVQMLSECSAVVFGKSGTLTKGVPQVQQVFSTGGMRDEQILAFAALAEAGVNHPVAKAICAKAGVHSMPNAEREVFPGMGVKASVNGHEICVGSAKMMLSMGRNVSEIGNFTAYVTLDDSVIGALLVTDEMREEAADCVKDLREIGVENIFLLTGANVAEATEVCRASGIEKAEHSLDPARKSDLVGKIADACGITVYLSDGVGESNVLQSADAGICVGAADPEATEQCSGLLTGDKLTCFSKAVDLCTRATTAVRINIILAIAVKAIVILLALFGVFGMWTAVLSDLIVALISALLSLRLLPKRGTPTAQQES